MHNPLRFCIHSSSTDSSKENSTQQKGFCPAPEKGKGFFNFEKAKKILIDLYSFFLINKKALREYYKYDSGNYRNDCCDFIAGMTDDFALEMHKSIFIPKKWSFVDFKI